MKGLTLIEIIIYISILVIIIIFIGGFLWNIILGAIKEGAWQEVQQNGRFTLAKIAKEVKKSTGINAPSQGEGSLNSLSLAMADPNLNPTVFEVVDGKLRIDQGGRQFFLTSDQVVISSLLFTNLSYQNTPGIIGVEMTIDHRNPGNRSEYQASADLATSISLLPGGAAFKKEILRPTDFTDSAGRTTDSQLAFDEQGGATWATTLYDVSANPSVAFHTWQAIAQTYSGLALKYRYHADPGTDDTYAVAYSTDGGTNWTDLILPTSQGSPDTTLSVDLSPAQDLSQLQVKIYSQKVRGTDKKGIYIRDIWTEGSF